MSEVNQHEDTAENPQYSTAYKRYVLGLLLIVYVINFTDRQIVTILLEPIKQDLGVSDTQLGFLSGVAFAIFYATLGIPLARWADSHNRVKLISASIVVWSAMTALCGMAGNFVQLVLARIGVGVGEAGCTPAAHSLISDYFPLDVRARAMAVYALGIPLGSTLGLMAGGFINELYGWRVAFLCVGLPGIFVALLVRLTLKEPPRGHADGLAAAAATSSPPKMPLGEVFSRLWRLHSFRHLACASALLSVAGYGSATWFPAFLIRIHGMTTTEVGAWLGPIAGIAGFVGTLLGGYLGDHLSLRDKRWLVWLPAIAMLIGVPFSIAALIADSWPVVLALAIVPTLTPAIYAGPVFSTVQALAGVRMRAMAAAVLLFVVNLIGLGLGPQLIGLASDLLKTSYGIESLRYTLLFATSISVWSALHFALAARHLREELAAPKP